MDGHVLIHGAVGVADAHQGAAGGHGGDEAGIADGDNALIQGGVFQVGHQRRFRGEHLRQQLLCHAGVQGDLGFGQGDVGNGGIGNFNGKAAEILTIRMAILCHLAAEVRSDLLFFAIGTIIIIPEEQVCGAGVRVFIDIIRTDTKCGRMDVAADIAAVLA